MLPDDLNGHHAGFTAVSPPPPPPLAPALVASKDPAVPSAVAQPPLPSLQWSRYRPESAPLPGTCEGGRRFRTPTATGPCAAHRLSRIAGAGRSRRRIPRLHRQSKQRYFRRRCQDLIGHPIARDTVHRGMKQKKRPGAPDRTPPRLNPESNGVGPLRRTEPQYDRTYEDPQSRYQSYTAESSGDDLRLHGDANCYCSASSHRPRSTRRD